MSIQPVTDNPCILAYSAAGAYGSLSLPYQAGISVAAPASGGIPGIAGYGSIVNQTADENYGGAGYGKGDMAYSDLSMMMGGVSVQDIYDAVDATKMEGTLVWVRVTAAVTPPVVTPPPSSTDDFTTDFSNDFI